MEKHDRNDVSIDELRPEQDVHTRAEKPFEGSTVPDKYKGTVADQQNMSVLGRKQVSSTSQCSE